SVMKREDPSDVFVSNKHKSLAKISEGQIGSSSPRRQALLKSMGKKLKVIEIRGNINTRLKKLNQSDMDGIILARAGLDRMEMGAVITESLDTDTFVPSPGQGILCIQYLADQKKELKKIKHIVDENTEICACAERIFAASMDGNCMSPIGAYAEINKNEMRLTGFVSKLDGTKYIKNIIVGHKKDYKNLSLKLSKLFISMGSKRMLKC
ncbi:MAG: hydroxymethylbilane synthase, partial [Gammaproteobacteria bacterium]